MSTFVFANNVSTTLASSVTSTQTTITLSSTSGLPTIPTGDVWALTLNDAATGTHYELVYVTATSGANLTVVRAQEGTTAQSWAVNDRAFAAVTAGILSSFSQEGGNFVELSPESPQSGSISITGTITAEGAGSFSGVSVGGALTEATTAAFSGEVEALDLALSQAYGATALASLPVSYKGSTGNIGLGASSSLSQYGITASALAIGLAGSSQYLVMDEDGNFAIAGSFYADGGVFAGQLSAPTILQDDVEVINLVTSPDGSINVTLPTPSHVELTLGTTFVGQTLAELFNPTPTQINEGYSASLSELPTGSWFVEITCIGWGLADVESDTITVEGTGGTFASSATLTGIAQSRTIIIAGTATEGQTPTATLSGSSVTYAAGSDAVFLIIQATRTS